MKNFRKVLALILVVATLFSFVAMASAKTADEYADYADVNYVQAVDVLTAIGINEGYDGKFHPADTIDRDEVAAMVARLLNGADFDADLYEGADKVFADVKGQWSEGYVTYCAQLGIIAGRNSTTFDPDGKVTGVEVLKMLLCALGYNAAEQGYTGANWQVNVIRDAKKSELLIEGVDPYAPATRDEVAQYFYNALVSRMVIGYLGEGIIDLTNSIWVDLVDADHVLDIIGVVTPDSVVTTDLGQFEVAYCNAIISGTFLWQSIKGLKVYADEDCYARPGITWEIGDWSKFYVATPVFSSTEGTDADTIAKNYGAAQYFMNGFPWEPVSTGNGTLVEVFEVLGGVRVCIKETYVGVVTYINSYNGNVTLGDVDGRSWIIAGLTDVAMGDVVLFHLCNGFNDATAIEVVGGIFDGITASEYEYEDGTPADVYVHDYTVLDPVVVDVEYGHIYADLNESNVTASGKTYNYNENYMLIVDPVTAMWEWANGALDFWRTDAADGKYDLYLDEYGYIMWAEPHVDAVKFAYAVAEEGTLHEVINGVDYDEYGAPVADVDYTAGLAKYDGEAGVVEVETTAVDTAMASAFIDFAGDHMEDDWVDNSGVPMLFRYSVDKDGNYVAYGRRAEFAAEGATLGKESWVLDPAKRIAADNDTLFMIRTTAADGSYTYKEVVGYKNLDRNYVANSVWVDGEESVTNIQYFADSDNFATYVFIDAHYTSAAAGTFMIISQVEWVAFDYTVRALYADNYFAYTALVDGTEGIILLPTNVQVIPGLLYTNVLEFIDLTVCGEHKLPLYVYADIYTPIVMEDPIMDFYLHKDNAGEMWVWVFDSENGPMGDYRLAKCAEGFKVYTVLTNADGDIETVIDETSIVKASDIAESVEGLKIAYGYVLFNNAGEVVAVYRIANTFLADMWF